MRIEETTRFQRLGARDYIHSTQIFAEFIRLAEPLGPSLGTVRLFKFIRETARNGRCVIAPIAEIDATSAASTIAFDAGAVGELLLAFVDDGEVADGGGADLAPRIAAVDHTGDFAGRVALSCSGLPQQLFVDLIEANKALHNATLLKGTPAAPPPYRFVYAENLPSRGEGGRALELVFKPREARQRGGHTYTLNEVSIASEPGAAPIRICFAF